MTVKQLIMHLVEMPQNAEVVCCCKSCNTYLHPYNVDFVQLETTSKSRPHLIYGNSQNDEVAVVDELVVVGSKKEIEYIEKKLPAIYAYTFLSIFFFLYIYIEIRITNIMISGNKYVVINSV